MHEVEIAALLYRYAQAVDTKDWELYRSVFIDDAHIDYSSAGAVVGSRDEVIVWFAANFGASPWSMHYITNIESEIDGDTSTRRRALRKRICEMARVASDNRTYSRTPRNHSGFAPARKVITLL